jgi:V/A-type H+/Na+-transporting ATPase subunit E
MPDYKLQELIDTLKKQGVEDGEAASRKIIADARKKAGDLLDGSRKEAERIIEEARLEADRRMEQLHSSMQIAASQFITHLKRVIEENLLTLPIEKAIEEALADTDFLKTIMETAVLAYARQAGGGDLEVLLPAEQKDRLADLPGLLSRKTAQQDDGNVLSLTLRSDGVQFGFMLSKANGNVRLDFTSESFQALFLRFLSPRFRGFFKDIDMAKIDGQ